MTHLRLEDFAPELLAPCNLSIGPGETVTLTGPSGSGKTLFLRAVADLDPHQGEAWLDDTPAREFAPPDWRRQVAYLPAESHWWAPRVGDHFENRDAALVEALGLPGTVFDWTVSRLSSGERQRLATARMLSIQPRVLLLDEVTANLDGTNTQRVETVIRNYQAATDAAIIWATHDPEQRARVGQRHFVIHEHRIEEESP
jgi:ABC-type iron transport system FetAB ATPase subunit